MYDVFDVNKSNKVEVKELSRLVEAELFSKEDVQTLTELSVNGVIRFSQFISFWIDRFFALDVKKEEEEESILRSALGPVLFKIALEQQNLKDIFGLLKKLFDVFDINTNGHIEKKEVAVLLEFDLIDAKGAERLVKWDTNVDGRINFKEFVAYFASEFVHQNDTKDKEKAKGEKESNKPLPDYLQKLAPIAFRLAVRTDDLNRVFGLLKKMFDAFDGDKDGLISKKELRKLVSIALFSQKDVDEMHNWKTTKRDALDFAEFLAFWIAKYVEGDFNASNNKPLESKDTDSSKKLKERANLVGPIVTRLSSSRQDIKKVYDLIYSLFNAFDDKKQGYINRSDFGELVKDGLLDDDGYQALLSLSTNNNDGTISFPQFFAFLCQQLAKGKGK